MQLGRVGLTIFLSLVSCLPKSRSNKEASIVSQPASQSRSEIGPCLERDPVRRQAEIDQILTTTMTKVIDERVVAVDASAKAELSEIICNASRRLAEANATDVQIREAQLNTETFATALVRRALIEQLQFYAKSASGKAAMSSKAKGSKSAPGPSGSTGSSGASGSTGPTGTTGRVLAKSAYATGATQSQSVETTGAPGAAAPVNGTMLKGSSQESATARRPATPTQDGRVKITTSTLRAVTLIICPLYPFC